MDLNKDQKRLLKEKRNKLELHILSTFDGKEMWYQEKRLQFKGIANITTDEWGVCINFKCENKKTFHLSGRWDVIIAYTNHIGAQYCGWSLDFQCPYPEWELDETQEER